MVLILLGNTCIARSVKFELIFHKIGLVFFAMEHDTRRLLCCLCNVNFKSETVYCFKTLGGF